MRYMPSASRIVLPCSTVCKAFLNSSIVATRTTLPVGFGRAGAFTLVFRIASTSELLRHFMVNSCSNFSSSALFGGTRRLAGTVDFVDG